MSINIFTWVSRILFGAVFIFAGFTKAIDPLGSAYKFEDYFLAFGMEGLLPLALPLAFILNVMELLVGFTILIGLKMQISAWVGLLFMAFFTPLTLYIAINNPVPDCGCFGDAVIISNWDTFYKNLIILVAVIVIFTQRKMIQPVWSEKKDWKLVGGIAIVVAGLSLYCLINLPVLDFRPWSKGSNIPEKLHTIQEEVVDYSFVYKNKGTGEKQEFAMDNIPTGDQWEYLDRNEIVIQEYIPAPIENFSIENEYHEDLTLEIIENPDFYFLAISHDLNQANKKAITAKLKDIAAGARTNGLEFTLLTSISFDEIESFRNEYQIPYTIYQSDERELKTIIRSNPGLVLMKNGTVIDKWPHRNIPSYRNIKEEYFQ